MITGQYVKSMRHPTIAKKEGIIAFDMFSMLSPDIAEATKRLMPYGGDMNPQARLTVIISPKCIGSIPIVLTTGSKIGVRIMTAAMLSTKQPRIRRNTFITIRSMNGVPARWVIHAAMCAGICAIAR